MKAPRAENDPKRRASRKSVPALAARPSRHTKLSAPLATPFQIVRRQIDDRISADESSRLVLIHGPAGFGKTTAMLQIRDGYQQRGSATAWLTLDDADNEVQRFLFFLAQAIDNLRGVASDAPTLSANEAQGSGDIALGLLDCIASWPDPFVIFLDDFESINNAVVLGLVSRLVESLPAYGHIVIGSRTVPAIALGRLRGKGHLTEIDTSLLRFSVEEATDLLNRRRGLSLNADQTSRLLQKTEGWVTAISLASMGMDRRTDFESFISSFSGSNAAVADFLAEDVLSRLPGNLREFMLKTSILSELSAPLCDHLCAISNSHEFLARAEADNLFLIPLDNERTAYRYHGLFASFLRTQLKRQMADQISRLHRSASAWYRAEGRPIPAINHALASRDMDYAVPLLRQYLDSLLGQGRLGLLGRWFDSIPAGTLSSQPYLRIAQAWSVLFTRGARTALELVKDIDADALEAEAKALLLALRPMLRAMMDDIDEAYELGTDVLPTVPPQYVFSHSMLVQALTNVCIIKGRFSEAHKLADQGRTVQGVASGRFNLALSESAEAIIDMMQGRLRQATIRLNMVSRQSSADIAGTRFGNSFSGIIYAETLYEANQCDQAQRLLEVYVPLARDVAQLDTLISSHVMLARIVARQGDHDRALQLLTELEATGHRLGVPRVVASARLERAHQALLQNDIRNAKEHLANAGDPALWQVISRRWFLANDTSTLTLGQLRWQIHSGSAAQALPALKRELEDAELGQRHRRALKIRILMADAMQRDGQHKMAMRMLTRAIDIAAAEGFVQTFLEEGPVIAGMLRELAERQTQSVGQFDSEILSAQGNWLARFRPASATSITPVISGGLDESLTRKEQQVLEQLALGLSNNAIAQKLFVSETTVRTHLRNIFAKLRAENRVQAVALARRYRLVE